MQINKLSFLMILIALIIFANNQVLASKKLSGFLWYNEEPKQATALKTIKPSSKAKLTQLQILKLKFKKALNIAIDQPTTLNIIKAQKLQKEIMDKSLKFAEIWQYVALLDPTLSSIKSHPNILQRKFNQQLVDIENKIKISSLSKNWGLILQVKENCLHCDKFAEIVKNFATEYNLQLLAATKAKNNYHGIITVLDKGQLDFINPKGEVPVLYLVSSNGKDIFPIARGINNQDKIIHNIHIINKYFKKLFKEHG